MWYGQYDTSYKCQSKIPTLGSLAQDKVNSILLHLVGCSFLFFFVAFGSENVMERFFLLNEMSLLFSFSFRFI